MKYVMIDGDERFACLARLLRQRGEEARTLGRDEVQDAPAGVEEALRGADRIVVNYPLRAGDGAFLPGKLLETASPCATVFLCGPKVLEPPLGDGRIVDLWRDGALVRENAWLTAEGAVAAVMRAGAFALRDARCMVIGWGRIGRALTEILTGIGARVTVASRSPEKRRRAVERGAETVPTGGIGRALPGHRVILNTAPELVLDAAALDAVERDALVVDLASPPFGVDLRAAWSRGLRAWREPRLPGRYAPENAAAALLRAMDRSGAAGGEGTAHV